MVVLRKNTSQTHPNTTTHKHLLAFFFLPRNVHWFLDVFGSCCCCGASGLAVQLPSMEGFRLDIVADKVMGDWVCLKHTSFYLR